MARFPPENGAIGEAGRRLSARSPVLGVVMSYSRWGVLATLAEGNLWGGVASVSDGARYCKWPVRDRRCAAWACGSAGPRL